MNNQAEDNQCKPSSPDNGHVQPTYHQHIIPNNQSDDQKCKSRILDEYNSYSNNSQHQYNHKNNHAGVKKNTIRQSILMVTTSRVAGLGRLSAGGKWP